MATDLQFHPFSNLFPLISGEEYEAFRSDIEAHGQRDPIILFEGQILDGRNRYRCCRDLGKEPVVEQYHGEDPLAYVLSLNLYRRQLSVAQRALIAAEFSSLRKQDETGNENPALNKLQLDEASKLMAVSARSISSACKVVREGVPELLLAVRSGDITVSAAELVSKLPKPEQQTLCEKGAKAIARAAREIREESKSERARPKASRVPPSTSDDAQEPAQAPEPWLQSGGSAAPEESECPVVQNTTKRILELAQEAMEFGYETETLVLRILDEVEDGLDMQLLLFTAEAMAKLHPRLQQQARQKYS